MRCWRYAAPSIMARSIGYSSGIDGAYEKRKNHRMLLVLKTADERTRTFFTETYPSMGRDAANPIISRINAFTRREAVRNILCQPGKSFNFRHAMDEAKIILFNLSDGILGEQASQLLGQIIISKIQLAAMSRADTPKAQRHPFYLYLDEFQTFTGVTETSYSRILSRARKYGLGLILAHQQTGQISEKLLKEIFGNVTTFISFSVSSDDARKLSKEYAFEVGQDVDFVPPGEFIRLQTGRALGKIGKTVFPLETYLLPTRVAGIFVRKYTLRRYAFFFKEIEVRSVEFSTPR